MMVIPARGGGARIGPGVHTRKSPFLHFHAQILQNGDSRTGGEAGRGEGDTCGNHDFGIFKAQIFQNGDSRAGVGAHVRESPFLAFSTPKSSKMVIPARGGAARGGVWHAQGLNPPER